MRLFARFVVIALLLVTFHFPLITDSHAQGEFTTDYKVNYNIDQNGLTTASQNITLKNNTANFYADKFELKIGSTKVENVKARDQTGPLDTDVKFENNVTSITVKFKQRVIGIGKTLNWTLTYTSNELATKSGQIWEVSIPRLAKSQDIGAYQATISVPPTFGKLAFAVPEPKNTGQAIKTDYSFDKDQLTESGIAMSFGEKQTFSFNLNYHIENQNLTTQTAEIALPPDNNYQKIVLEKLNPRPFDVAVDKDGNFIAKYRLNPHNGLDITAQGSVEVFSKPFRKIEVSLSKEDRERYTQPQKYWEIDNAQIREKSSQLHDPRQIYDFVETTLSYNRERLTQDKVERKGATATLTDPKDAICTDFTDLFIALARSAGIPAREIEGYAYSQNERLRPLSLTLQGRDILHAWPEYWDDRLGWVQVDPTWGSTSGGLDYFNKLDFNHITFVQRGLSSTAPFPAGSYKKDGTDKKDVDVAFAEDLPTESQIAQIDLEAPSTIISGIPTRISVQLANTGNSSIIGGTLQATTKRLKFTDSDQSITVPILPPFASKNFTFHLQATSLLTHFEDALVLTFADAQAQKTIKIFPVYRLFFSANFVASVVVASVIIIFGLLLYKKLPHRRF